jgi:hypothetical protein
VFASVGRYLPPLIALARLSDPARDPSLVVVPVGLVAVGSLEFPLGSGGFILRCGARRMSQLSLVMLAAGLAAAAGAIFPAAMLVAMPELVVMGWVSSRIAAPAAVLGWLTVGRAVSAAVLALSGPSWPAVA